ncbi:MAG: tetratricopeptide repeat protein [Desulfatiglans sp.]|jgi:tetratricopeptide (TPR) repeat protein|nr:tetratricopeptide repeat protein [Desulfatiglans sp.]
MLRRRVIFVLALIGGTVLLSWRAHPVFGDQIILDGREQMNYAVSLMKDGNYALAIGEFERFVHFFPEDPDITKARYLMGVCRFRNREYEAARKTFFQLIEIGPTSLIAGKAIFLIGESYYQQRVYQEAERYFTEVVERYSHLELKNAALFRLGWTKMNQDMWQEASQAFQRVDQESSYYERSRKLAQKGLAGETLPQKSPGLAGSLAAIVPGSGHVYVSRYRDGIIALLINGLFIWGAIESFDEDHEALGTLLTLVEIGWYGGNIYSAVSAAHKHNRNVKDKFRRGLKEDLNFDLLISKKDRIGLALTYRF